MGALGKNVKFSGENYVNDRPEREKLLFLSFTAKFSSAQKTALLNSQRTKFEFLCEKLQTAPPPPQKQS